MENKNIGKQIKLHRIDKEMTQGQLAKALGVNSYTISDWECNRTAPDIDSLRKLCVIFDITSDELLQIETETQRKQVFNNNTVHLTNSNNNNKITF